MCIGTASGVALIVAIDIINASILSEFTRTIEQMAGPADLQVSMRMGEVSFDESVVDGILSHPDVQTAIPVVRGSLSLPDQRDATLHVFGTDLAAEEELERYKVTLATNRRSASEAVVDIASIFLSERVAEDFGIQLGDQIRVDSPIGVKSLTVRGLLATEGFARAFDGRMAVLDIGAAQWLFAKPEQIDQIDIVLRGDASIDGAKVALSASLPQTFDVLEPAESSARYDGVLASFQAMLTGLSLLCMIAGLFIIYNSTATAALRRSPVYAGLRLIGAQRRRLLRVLLNEATFLGAIGSTLGLLFGIPLAWLLSGTIGQSTGIIFQLRFPIGELALNPIRLFIIWCVGIAVTIFASSFSARKMASIDPLILAREGTSGEHLAPSNTRLVVAWIGLLLVSIAAFAIEHRTQSIAWGNFGSTVWNASVIVIAVPLVHGSSKFIGRFLPRWFGAAGQMAAGSLTRSGTRSGITVAAIALILTIATLLSSLVLSCRESLASYFAGFFAADLTVSAVATNGGWLESALPRELAERIAAFEGVQRVETARAITGQEYQSKRIALVGVSSGFFDTSRVPPGWYAEGDPAQSEGALKSGLGANISTSLANRFDLAVGDTVVLPTPKGDFGVNVLGVVPDYVSDRGSVILHRDLIEEHWGDTRVNRILVFADPIVRLDILQRTLLDAFEGEFRLKVLTTKELLKYHTDMIDRAFAVMNSIQLLIVIITVVGIFDLLVSRITERRKELALWRVIGAGEKVVRKSIAVESLTIGAMGIILGLVVGATTVGLWIHIHFRELLGYYVQYHFAWGAALWYVLLILAMTLITGYAAARWAVIQPVLDNIRED